MSLVLPKPPKFEDMGAVRRGLTSHLSRIQLALEQADRQNWKKTGDVEHGHSVKLDGGPNDSNLHVNGLVFFEDVATGITASTTQTQGQEPLTATVNIVATVANTNDVVTLPAASLGRFCLLRNEGANVLQIFPASGDAINGGSVDASITLTADTGIAFVSVDATNWYSFSGL